MKYTELVGHIEQVHDAWYIEATKAINVALKLRNWMIGYCILEYEQDGEDRAAYGKGLLQQLEAQLRPSGIKGMNVRAFRNYRKFYQVYPAIRRLLTTDSDDAKLLTILPSNLELSKRRLPTTESDNTNIVPIHKVIKRLSYTHLEQLIHIDDITKRAFYEIETIKGNWSVSQLKRQINSLYYERSAMSKNPELLTPKITQPSDIVHDVYSLEFMGLPTKMAVSESDLEKAILDNIEHFLLELGHGFCFEARQKKILIGDEYYFIDLVFYHRLLKCHVLIDLKVEGFSHENAGQLNTYINYYKAEVMDNGDNPPIGILFVTDKNRALVEYATAGMDERLFVKQYLVSLPDKSKMEDLIAKEINKI